jgi:hypothetical protein
VQLSYSLDSFGQLLYVALAAVAPSIGRNVCVSSLKMTDTYGDGICCQYGAGGFKKTLNGEPVAITSRSE